ncbi:hypothetical protein [Methylomonas sp. CM2]|uniref:hypothetical protein n=1 Tax=Methylomonas sp. CM2 TaxID=3417647 RepID=UPI003CEFD54F
MPTIRYGTKNETGFDLEASDYLIAVRTRNGPITQPVRRNASAVPPNDTFHTLADRLSVSALRPC